MLEGLDDINWKELHHAYGEASDVPQQIRDLASRNTAKREKAGHDLYGNVFHQGTRWEASAYAVPFLFELLDDPSTPDRAQLVHRILLLGVGYEEAFLAEPFDSTAARLAQAQWTDNEFHVDVIHVYDAVVSGGESLLRAATDADREVRRAAIYALAFLPELTHDAMPIAIRAASEEDATDMANALLAAGLIAQAASEPDEVLERCAHVSEQEPWLQRFAAAVSVLRLARATDDSFATAYSFLLETLEMDEIDSQGLWWNEGDLRGLAAIVMRHAASSLDIEAAKRMANALATLRWTQAETMAGVLLSAAFPRGEPDVPEQADALNPVQRVVVEALANTNGWYVDLPGRPRAGFANFGNLVCAYGLPGSQEGNANYLAGAPVTECLLPGQSRHRDQ